MIMRVERRPRFRPAMHRRAADDHPRRPSFGVTRRGDCRAQPNIGQVVAYGVEPPVEGHARQSRGSTSWVCVTIAASLPSALKMRVSTTIVRRPTWIGTETPVILPGGDARKKLLFDSTVVVRIPSGMLSPAVVPPRS